MFIPKPYSDELLSSWIFRISRANYTRQSNIISKLFLTKRFYKKDLDLFDFSKIDLSLFYKLTKIKSINKYQLRKYTSFLEEDLDQIPRRRWITPIQYKKDNVFFGTRFCPICLKEKKYIKQEWRLMIVNICKKHLCFLENSCPNCGKAIKYLNSDYNQQISECHFCNFDLTNTKIIMVKRNSIHIKTQEKLLSILTKGYYKLNNRYYYSIGLFYLMRIIIKNIMKVYKIENTYIETLKPKTLSFLISYSILLLEKFPLRINRFYKKNKLSNINRILDKYRYKKQNIPNWFLSGIQYNNISTRWYF